MAWSTVKKPAGKPDLSPGTSLPAPAYRLVFLDSAGDVAEGTEMGMEASYVSLGRNRECMICYGEEFPMVSRLHAAIEWSNGSYTLSHLSATNQTLLNGRPISRRWFLADGDVIQLAPSGPKLRFLLPEKGGRSKPNLYQIAIGVVVFACMLLLAWLLYRIITGA